MINKKLTGPDCGNSLSNGGGPASDGNAGCDMACNGNPAETCGGPDRLNMYSYNGTTAVGSATGPSSAPTGTATGSSTPTGLPEGWTYKGCWIDEAYGRILINSEPDSSTLTVQSCIKTCVGLGFSIAGMEYYTQCYCGDAIINQGAEATSDSDCNTACGGNSAEICGGGDRMSIYSNQTTLDVTPVPVVQKTGLPGSWQYLGCLL